MKIAPKILSFFAAAALLTGPAFANSMAGNSMMANGHDRYGGNSYTGSPNLDVTAALAKAGGGATTFSIDKALNAMVGEKLVDGELAKLTKQYGKKSVTSWVTVFNYAVDDAAKTATAAGVRFPAPPADLKGKELAGKIVALGSTKNNTFWTGDMLDHLVTHKIHDSTMNDIDAKYGAAADANYHKITNQAMYDLAQALGATSVKLANLH
ncbi:MAG: hypothetical protein ACREM8_05485 [Vulcanimicrobiaceae bacterium]